jgi:peroxiredoxin Q/BCP
MARPGPRVIGFAPRRAIGRSRLAGAAAAPSFSGNPQHQDEEARIMSVEVGQPAPDFTLPKAGGGEVSLSALRGRPVIVYFYPKADTSGCTKEACGFNEALPDFSGAEAEIVGISKDPVKKLDKFAEKYGLGFTLASDEGGDTVERYGSWVEKSMYGKTYMGIDRSTFLIGADGTVKGVWRKVKVPGHVQAVLEAARSA